VAALCELVARSGVTWLQLHAFQLPRVVRALKAGPGAPAVRLVKVLHVRDGRCIEGGLVAAYERAGVDAFLIDATTSDGRVGSTGTAVAPAVAAALAGSLRRPFFLAGGISAAGRPAYERLVRDARFLGVDVDSAARDGDGRIAGERVAAIRRAWSGRDVVAVH
jgi:phosphoribosylanthranilate isomerase